jgi:hypothetical protein
MGCEVMLPTGRPAIQESTGETFAEMAVRRQRDAEDRPPAAATLEDGRES